MIKTIKLNDEKELTLSNNLAWATIYRDQFGHDIVPDVMPILSAVLRLINEVKDYTDVNQLIKTVNFYTLQDTLIELCAFQFTDFRNLVWAFAKAYDENTEAPEKWVRQFDEFPLDIIVPAVFELLTKGMISSKNLKSLQRKKTPKKA